MSQEDHLRQLNQLQASVNRSAQISPVRFPSPMHSPTMSKRTISPTNKKRQQTKTTMSSRTSQESYYLEGSHRNTFFPPEPNGPNDHVEETDDIDSRMNPLDLQEERK